MDLWYYDGQIVKTTDFEFEDVSSRASWSQAELLVFNLFGFTSFCFVLYFFSFEASPFGFLLFALFSTAVVPIFFLFIWLGFCCAVRTRYADTRYFIFSRYEYLLCRFSLFVVLCMRSNNKPAPSSLDFFKYR